MAYDPVAFAALAAYAPRQNYRTICSVIRIAILITLILVQSGDSFEEILIRLAQKSSFLILPVNLFPVDVGVLRLVALEVRLGVGEDLVVHLPGPGGFLPFVFSTFDLAFTSSVQLLEADLGSVRSPYERNQPSDNKGHLGKGGGLFSALVQKKGPSYLPDC